MTWPRHSRSFCANSSLFGAITASHHAECMANGQSGPGRLATRGSLPVNGLATAVCGKICVRVCSRMDARLASVGGSCAPPPDSARQTAATAQSAAHACFFSPEPPRSQPRAMATLVSILAHAVCYNITNVRLLCCRMQTMQKKALTGPHGHGSLLFHARQPVASHRVVTCLPLCIGTFFANKCLM